MKILWLSHLVPYPPKGGVLQRAYYMLRELSKYHEIDLLAFNQESLMSSMYPSVEQGEAEAKKELGRICRHFDTFQIDSVKGVLGRYGLAARSLVGKEPYSIAWLKSDSYSDALGRRVKSESYDLIHFDTISLVPFMNIVTDVPTVLDHHNIESHMLLRRSENETNLLKKAYFRQEGRRLEQYERQWCQQFSLNIVCSDVDEIRLREIMPEGRISVVPNGVDTDFFKPTHGEHNSSSLIFVGTMNWYPNVEAVRFIAYELWPTLKKRLPELTIDIVGANPPADIVNFGASNADFKVHGFVNDIIPMIDQATVYVCPITDGGGTKLKILDALSMEKAIVAHPIACEGIDVTDGKDVVLVDGPDEYVQAIERLIRDGDRRSDLGRNARQLAKKEYSYAKVGEFLSRLYADVVNKFESQSG